MELMKYRLSGNVVLSTSHTKGFLI